MNARLIVTVVAFSVIAAIPIPAASQVPSAPVCSQKHVADSDRDGLSDACEFNLARTFAPILVVGSGRCDWDVGNRRLAGGYFYAVQRVRNGIRIAYLPAYFKDCGWKGIKCRLPRVDCTPHDGDSEFIAVELSSERDPVITGVFLSAHCFGKYGQACRWYRNAELAEFRWKDGAPVVWVAEGRHANYPTRRACDRGLHSIDTCDRNAVRYRYPIGEDHNVGGSDSQTLGCVRGVELQSHMVDAEAIECFWRSNANFAGWQAHAKGVTGYYRYLHDVTEF